MNVFTALNPGTYDLVVTDFVNACSTTYPGIVVPGTYVEPTYDITPSDVSRCYDGSNGTISGTLIDGRGPFYYQIIAGPCCITSPLDYSNTSGTFTGLSAGTYTVRGYDSCGNFQTRQTTIANFQWSITSNSSTKTGCGAYTLDAVNLSGTVAGVSYSVKQGVAVLATGSTLPLSFSNSDNTINTVQVCVTDSCGHTSCTTLSAPADWSISSALTSYDYCGTFSVNSISISGSPISPVSFGFVRASGDTIFSASVPFTFSKVGGYNNFHGTEIVIDGCGVIKSQPNANEDFMDISGHASSSYTSCSLSTLTAAVSNRYIEPVTYSLNGGAPQASGIFTGLTDGVYTVTIVDSCGASKDVIKSVSHLWDLQNTSAYHACLGSGSGVTYTVPSNAFNPIDVQMYSASWTPIGGLVSRNPGDVVYVENLDSLTTYHFIATDFCGRNDTLTITTLNGSLPNTHATTATPLCINKGDIHVSVPHSDHGGVVYIDYGLVGTTPPLSYGAAGSLNNGGSHTYNNKDTGTYWVRYASQYCSEVGFDTVTISRYGLPKLKKSIAIDCGANVINAIGAGTGGIKPYTYEIFQTIPSGGEQGVQASNLFTLTGPYTLIRMRVVDACGNTSIQDMAARPAGPLAIRTKDRMPACNMTAFTMYVDSSFSGATYEWKNKYGVTIGTHASVVNDPISLADTGLYTCRIIIPGTCFDVTSEFRLRGKDFGCYAQLGDFVWNDTDHDGIQDSGEVGVAGVTVNLYDNTNAPVSSTVTDAYGKYLFTWLNPGTYHVGFSLPSNYVFSPKDQVGTDATDSDPDVNSGLTGNYTLIAGDSNMTVDAGIYLNDVKASIGDIVWNDLNNDGIQDINELGVPGVTVTLYDSIGGFINSKVTDALGNYIFTGLDAGRYQIGFSNLPSGFSFSTANQGGNDALDADADGLSSGLTGFYTLAGGDQNMTVDAGIHQSGSLAQLGNFVWNDLNQDGIQDLGEPGVAGVTVTLYNTSDVALGSTTTNASGAYQFTGLAAGTYYVEFTNLPAGYVFTDRNAAGNSLDAFDSDADPNSGATQWVTLSSGQNYPDLDAGIYTEQQTGLGNFVWHDTDNDGIQDVGESGVPGITVTLYASDGTTVINTTVTNAAGYYTFVNLDAGTYVVGFSNLPAGTNLSDATQGGDTALDSNPDVSTGKTGQITIAAGEYNPTIDAGIYFPVASIGNFVWLDDDADGIQDGGEVGVQGITVKLYNGVGDSINVMTTDVNGHYLFDNLTPGNYMVGFSNLPVKYKITLANQGGNDALDSDPSAITGMTGVYSLAPGENNMTADAGITCKLLPKPIITSYPNGQYCFGSTIVLKAVGIVGTNYNWYKPSGTTVSIDNSVPGESKLTISNLNGTYNGYYSANQYYTGCPVSPLDSVHITGAAQPTINFVTTSCVSNNGEVTVNATGSGPLEYSINGGSYQVSNVLTTTPGSAFVVAVRVIGYTCPAYYSGECVYCVPSGACTNPPEDSIVVTSMSCVTAPISITGYFENASTGTWTSSGTGVFSSTSCLTSPCTVTYTPSATDVLVGNVVITYTTDDPDGAGPCSAAACKKNIMLYNGTVPPILTSNGPICANNLLQVYATGAPGNISWTGPNGFTSTGDTVSRTNAAVNMSGTYTATVSIPGCVSTSSSNISVTVLAPPSLTVNVTGNPELCIGAGNGSIDVSISGGTGPYTVCYNTNLSNCSTGSNVHFSWITPGDYTVTVVDQSCPNNVFSYPVTVAPGTVVPPPTIASTITTCVGEDLVLSGSVTAPAVNILWVYAPNALNATGNPLTIPDATLGMNGIYYAKAVNAAGCASTQVPVTIVVNAKPVITHIQVNCKDNIASVTISATVTSGTLTYSLDGSVYQSSPLFNNVTAGSYTVYVKNNTGDCITVLPISVVNCACKNGPELTITAPEVSCGNTTVPLIGTFINVGNATWSTGGTGSFSVTSGSSPLSTVYTPSLADIAAGHVNLVLTTDDPDGAGPCTATSDFVVVAFVDSLITPVITKNQATYCAGDDVELVAIHTNSSVVWTGAGGFTVANDTATLANATQFVSGFYTVTSSGNGCVSKSASILLVVAAPPNLTLNTVMSPEGCEGQANGAIHATATGGSGLYNFCNVTNPTCYNNTTYADFKYLMPISYVLKVSDAVCPNSWTNKTVAVAAGPHVDPPTSIVDSACCEGEPLVLTVGSPLSGSYLWTNTDNNFTATGNSVSRPNSVFAMSGLYKVQHVVSGCASLPLYFNAKVFLVPTITSINTFCMNANVEDAGRLVIGSTVGGLLIGDAVGGPDPVEYSINNGAFQSSNIFDGLTNGLYSVKTRTIGSDCISTLQTIDLYCECTCGRDELLNIFPNPNNGTFTLNSILVKPSDNISINIYDMVGKLIYKKHIDTKTEVLHEDINIVGFAAGTYMVNVKIDDNTYLLPVVVN